MDISDKKKKVFVEEEAGYCFFLNALLDPEKAMQELRKQITQRKRIKGFLKNLETSTKFHEKDTSGEVEEKEEADFCCHLGEEYYEAYGIS